MDKNIMASDPFVTLDQRGVGTLVHMAVKKARKGNPKAQVQTFMHANMKQLLCHVRLVYYLMRVHIVDWSMWRARRRP